MTRLIVHVEGQTEEDFVNSILAPHLYNRGFQSVGARLVGNARLRSSRGGIKPWSTVKSDIIRHLAGDGGCVATTMVDYYALPSSWPGRTEAASLVYNERGAHVQSIVADDVNSSCPYGNRFIPFVLMHEFEALLFSDCELFAQGIGQPTKAAAFQAIRSQFASPEEINDSPQTAPSKRVEAIVPGYQKPLYGNLAALEIGLDKMREQCPHFGNWLERLEALIS